MKVTSWIYLQAAEFGSTFQELNTTYLVLTSGSEYIGHWNETIIVNRSNRFQSLFTSLEKIESWGNELEGLRGQTWKHIQLISQAAKAINHEILFTKSGHE